MITKFAGPSNLPVVVAQSNQRLHHVSSLMFEYITSGTHEEHILHKRYNAIFPIFMWLNDISE